MVALAAERSVSSLTIADITDRAGVNRTTFYAHATTPSELLRDALREQLDAVRQRFFVDAGRSVPTTEATRNTVVGVLEHLEDNAELYLRAFTDETSDAGLRSMLADHFEATALAAVRDHTIELPDDPSFSDADRSLLAATAPRVIANAAVAAMEVWLRTPAPRDHQTFLTVYRLVLPAWWPLEVAA